MELSFALDSFYRLCVLCTVQQKHSKLESQCFLSNFLAPDKLVFNNNNNK